MIHQRTAAILTSLFIVFTLHGCASSPSARHYLLTSSEKPAAPVTNETSRLIFVTPVVLADYLKREEIVLRSSEHRLDITEYDRWAEPLDRNVTSVISTNLAKRFGDNNVIDYYSNFSLKPDMTLRLRISEFGPNIEDVVILKAAWEVSSRERQEPLLFSTIITKASTGQEISDHVSNMSSALGDLSDRIASSILEISE